jgi:hypothetical protein
MFINTNLIHFLPPDARRCFDRKEAASYVCVSPTTFDKLVRQGTMPKPDSVSWPQGLGPAGDRPVP